MDLKQLKSLVQLMVENDLSRLELHEGETRVLLRRGQPPVTTANPAVHPVNPTSANAPAPAAEAPGQPAAPDSTEHMIRSPMVGTFYTATDPETPPFVNVGDQVHPDTPVCLVEAMKVFNEIKAEVSGRITKILVKNAQAVEFDQPLFAVTPA
ncbi:MAG: acetyl-CoA carboxylase biotin carboxyl carrier protein [Planctomycetota bacterium]